jgi:hypothetical protein
MSVKNASYKCDVCGAVFKDADSLTKHMAIHRGHESEAPLEQETYKPNTDPTFFDPGPPHPHG